VVMVAQPNLGSGSCIAVVAGIANAICAASGVLFVRWLRSTEQPLSLALTTSIVCAASLFLPAQLSWSDRAPDVMFELAALGIMGGSATLLLNLAYSSAPAPLLASLDFLAVPGSMVAGSVLWDQQLSWIAACGCAVIVIAGLSNAVRPRLSGKPFSRKVCRTP
jgi:drug/metabolite transporter (DMT)-like permease